MKELFIFLLSLLFIESIISIRCIRGRALGKICICPSDYNNTNGECLKIPIRCKGGIISDNHCFCPPRTKLINGECKKYF